MNFQIIGKRCARFMRRSILLPKPARREVYLHEMPGGQYTNLKEQAASMGLANRWPEIARTYAEVNELFGDIVKVTPSSKSGRRHDHVSHHAAASSRRRSESRTRRHAVSGIRHRHALRWIGTTAWRLAKKITARRAGQTQTYPRSPGKSLPPLNFKKAKTDLAAKLKREVSDDDLYSI